MKVPIGITNAIDETFRLRKEIEMLKTQEAGLSETVKDYMESTGVHSIETTKTVAEYTERSKMVVDADKLYDALETDWTRFISCMSVRLEPNKKKGLRGAREFMGEEDLAKISKVDVSQVLSVKSLPAVVVEKPVVKKGRAAKA
jgi:hypothetical protein